MQTIYLLYFCFQVREKKPNTRIYANGWKKKSVYRWHLNKIIHTCTNNQLQNYLIRRTEHLRSLHFLKECVHEWRLFIFLLFILLIYDLISRSIKIGSKSKTNIDQRYRCWFFVLITSCSFAQIFFQSIIWNTWCRLLLHRICSWMTSLHISSVLFFNF